MLSNKQKAQKLLRAKRCKEMEMARLADKEQGPKEVGLPKQPEDRKEEHLLPHILPGGAAAEPRGEQEKEEAGQNVSLPSEFRETVSNELDEDEVLIFNQQEMAEEVEWLLQRDGDDEEEGGSSDKLWNATEFPESHEEEKDPERGGDEAMDESVPKMEQKVAGAMVDNVDVNADDDDAMIVGAQQVEAENVAEDVGPLEEAGGRLFDNIEYARMLLKSEPAAEEEAHLSFPETAGLGLDADVWMEDEEMNSEWVHEPPTFEG